MGSISLNLKGDMLSGLKKLADNMGEETLRAVGFAGAATIRDEAIARVPVDKGIIKRNIIIKRAEESSNSNKKQTYLVTVRKGKFNAEGDAFYWRWVEEGHRYVKKRKGDEKIKAARLASQAEYGTSKKGATPFLRPAYEAKKNDAVEAMQKRFLEKLKEKAGDIK